HERMVRFLAQLRDEGLDGWAVQHTAAPDQAARLVERGREILGSEPVFVSEVGPVVGSHVGPGLLAVGGVPRALLL
ncbi:MAG: DegV family protein, partial [Solirubrobacterales bacterium]|nr:DegV family protein [Solirubrobacterales bacterium]